MIKKAADMQTEYRPNMRDGNGTVGYGLGKAGEVSEAIRKGLEDAKKNICTVTLQGSTIPHEVIGEFGAGLRHRRTGDAEDRRIRHIGQEGQRGGQRFAQRGGAGGGTVSALVKRDTRGVYHKRYLILEDKELYLIFDASLLKALYAVVL